MKEKKTVIVTTNLFQLKIYWNGLYVSAQIAVLIGIALIRLFAQQDSVKLFCIVALLGDLAAVLFVLLNGAKVQMCDGDVIEDTPKDTLDISVEGNKKPKQKPKQSVHNNNESVIRNKVETPNPPVTPVQEEPVVQEPAAPISSVTKMEDLTVEDWEQLFGGDDSDDMW